MGEFICVSLCDVVVQHIRVKIELKVNGSGRILFCSVLFCSGLAEVRQVLSSDHQNQNSARTLGILAEFSFW